MAGDPPSLLLAARPLSDLFLVPTPQLRTSGLCRIVRREDPLALDEGDLLNVSARLPRGRHALTGLLEGHLDLRLALGIVVVLLAALQISHLYIIAVVLIIFNIIRNNSSPAIILKVDELKHCGRFTSPPLSLD